MANLYDLKSIKCKTCGEPLDINKAVGGVIKCGVCDSCFTLPKPDASQKVLDYLFQAEGDLDTGKFDDAYTKFAKAAELDKTEPEAYFGMALAEHKIQYLKDEVYNRLQPICHEINDKDFADGANFLKAIRYATDEQRKEYGRRADEIDLIKKEFYKLKKSGVKYDCFICVKVSDGNGGNTADSEFAHRIYRMLKDNSFVPFYSEAVLKNVTGADYEAHILYALATSETMLLICFDEAYLRTKWVKNEYLRFLKLVNDEEKESDALALIYRGKPIEKLPGKNGKIQGVDANRLDCSHIILQYVERHTPEARRKREEEEKRKEKENEALRNELAELKKMLLNQQSAQTAKISETEKKEAERIAAEEEQARLQAERDRKEKERKEQEAERKAAEEAKRKAREEAERKAAEEQARKQRESVYFAGGKVLKCSACGGDLYVPNHAECVAKCEYCDSVFKISEEVKNALIARDFEHDFEIENGVLKKYKGSATEVVIPDGVTSIGEEAFKDCGNITSVTIPNGVTSIGDWAFSWCSGLSSIKIPNSVTNIGGAAFQHCTGLKSITIPNSVKIIGLAAFGCCSWLESITVESGNTQFKSENNCLLSKDGKTLIAGCKNSKIPPSVTGIGDGAFFGCRTLTSITVPDGITNIGESSFSDTAVESITLPDSVINIGNYAFMSCDRLESITLPKGITYISEGAFKVCSKLESIAIPAKVKKIERWAFERCYALTSIKFNGTKIRWKMIRKRVNWDENTSDYTIYCTNGELKKEKS